MSATYTPLQRGYAWIAPLLTYVEMPRREQIALGLLTTNVDRHGISDEVAARILRRAADKLEGKL